MMRLSELWLKLQVVHKLNVKIRKNVYVSGIVGWGLATWHFYWSIISCLINQNVNHARPKRWFDFNLFTTTCSFISLPPNIVALLKAFLFCTFNWNTLLSNFYAVCQIIPYHIRNLKEINLLDTWLTYVFNLI